MNILMINGADRKGGAHELAWDLKCGLEKRGNLVKMFVSKKYTNDNSVYEIKVPIYQKLLSRLFATDINFFSTNKILKTEQFKKADVVHCHNLHGRYFNLNTLKKISKVKPLVWTLHDEWPITSHCVYTINGKQKEGFYECPSLKTPPGIKWNNTKYLKWRKKSVYKNTNVDLVTPSRWLKERVLNSVLGSKEVNLIYNGIDNNIFKGYNKPSIRSKLGLPEQKKIVLFLAAGGKDNLWKGWSYVEKMITNYGKDSNVLFLCIGNKAGEDSPDKKIRFLPYVYSKQALAEYYSCADVFLFPSLADNFPLTILEAMSCRLPIVSFDVGGVKEAVIDGINGYIAEYGNVEDLKNGIKFILDLNDEDYKKMSNNCCQRVEDNFTLDIMTNKYFDLYKKVMRKYVKTKVEKNSKENYWLGQS